MAQAARVVIIGAGHAGGTAAALLRQYGHQGPIVLVGEELLAPYQRPPLSKAWLKGEADAETLALKPLAFYEENGIELLCGVRAEHIDRAERSVALSTGARLAYDVLILATGMRPMSLAIPGADLRGVLTLRTAVDAEALKLSIAGGRRLAIIGGGYIGLEVAASARTLGAETVVVEREERLLARSACAPISHFLHDYHCSRGVMFKLGAAVSALEGSGGRVSGVRLATGERLDADAVLMGVGGRPNDELAAQAGLEVTRGIVVDTASRTSDPNIYAIGDASHRPIPLYGRMFSPESVPSALEQARQAACAIMGRPAPKPETPWNWSDQYDLKIQIAGLPFDVDDVLVRGEPNSRSFAVFHLNGDRVQAVEAVNAAPEFMMGRQLIGDRRAIDRGRLRDRSVSMKDVVAASEVRRTPA